MDELKPCPFCGGEADYYLGDGGYVQCSHCLATIPYRYELPYGEGKKQAITAWNRRPAPENKPLTCEGCVNNGCWENEVEYGYPSPCTGCKRRASDNYARKPEQEEK